ncbi:hypothetical protein BKA57DRAFT_510914 [Linnemannia elongata]|nr:hypothetical protein BKA57DRAFT_510914 [Linnemannia elongata]
MNAERKPTVMIIGAGLGGLLLGTLLHRADISFNIFEKTPSKELLEIANPVGELRVHNEKRELNYTLDFSDQEHLTGHKVYLVARPLLYDLLLRQIPADRVHRSKRMLTKLEADDGIIIKISDGSTYKGDILVGADGACSTVRQRLFDRLKNEEKLCKGDREHLPFRSICLTGRTPVPDPVKASEVNTSHCDFYAVMVSTTPQRTTSWMAIRHLDKAASVDLENQRLKNTENAGWGPLAVQGMCDETRGIAIPGGNGDMTLGDIMDLTPKDLMSKVMLEEKVFETWYSGRTVLLGDGST